MNDSPCKFLSAFQYWHGGNLHQTVAKDDFVEDDRRFLLTIPDVYLPLRVIFGADDLHDLCVELDVRKDGEMLCIVLDVVVDLRCWEVCRRI